MQDERENMLLAASKTVEDVRSYQLESLARVDELGSKFSFAEALPLLRRIANVFVPLTPDRLKSVGVDLLSQIHNQGQGFLGELQAIKAFSPSVYEASQQREQLLQRLRNREHESIVTIGPALAYLSIQAGNEARAELEAVRLLKTEAQALLTEAKSANKAAKEASSNAASDSYSRYFGVQVAHHETRACWWLFATVLAVLLLVGYAVTILVVHLVPAYRTSLNLDSLVGPASAQLAVSKAVLFATLASIAVACSRVYQGHVHNAVVNRHRQQNMRTFPALVEASKEPAAKDLILSKAADSVFAAQPTGFGKTDAADPSPLSILNVTSPVARPPGV